MRISISIIGLLCWISCLGCRPAESEAPATLPNQEAAAPNPIRQRLASEECQKWVDSVYASLDQRQRVAQLFIGHLSPAHGDLSRSSIKKLVADCQVGGLLFSKGDITDYAAMTNYAQSLAQTPLLMTLDGEWGVAMRVPQAPCFPRNMALGAISDPQMMRLYGREMARQCRAMGIQVNFAPVLDVNSNPNNPVIGTRSFGDDPRRVAEAGIAYALGLEDGGVLSVAKHFPGHGDTETDSHATLPIVGRSLAQLDSVEIMPFRLYAQSGAGGVMVGHISVPALDASGTPASLSKAVSTHWLRDSLGFDGLVFTDALSMKGAKMQGDNCVAAFKAGADMLLSPVSVEGGIKAMLQAVEKGEIPAEEVERRCRKVLAYKYALGLNDLQPVDEAGAEANLNTEYAHALIQQLSDSSITIVRNRGGILPVRDIRPGAVAIVNIGKPQSDAFASWCGKYAPVDVFNYSSLRRSDIDSLSKRPVVIAAVYGEGRQAANSLAALKAVPGLVPVFFTKPYNVSRFSNALEDCPALVMAYEDTPSAMAAAAKAVFGGIGASGRLSVGIDGVAPSGAGISTKVVRLGYGHPTDAGLAADMESRMDSVVLAAIEAGAFPGAQLIVGRHGRIVVDKCYGTITWGGDSVTPNTLYDMASVSKTVGTLPGIMKAYDYGLFSLDEAASKYIPGLRKPGKSDITPRMLLVHETGMPPSMSMYYLMFDPDTYTGKLFTGKRDAAHTMRVDSKLFGHKSARLRTDILASAPTDRLGIEAAKGIYVGEATYDTIMSRIYDIDLRSSRRTCYSCLNFCLLMDLEQRLTGQPHQQWVSEQVWQPIGATRFCYRPTEKYPLNEIAYTEKDSYLRRQHVHGYVHDELAAFSGGVQGNAGVFGTAADIAKLCQTWLWGGSYGGVEVFSPKTNRLFTTYKAANSRRGLGFDKPDTENPDNSPTCEQAGPSVYGHTGFTGTIFWVDPENDFFFVFLCNRVDPTRENAVWSSLGVRPELMSIIYDSIEDKQ